MRILLALDGSRESLEAGRFLSLLPLPAGSSVRVVSVLVESKFDVVEDEAGVQLREVEREGARRHYQAVCQRLQAAGVATEHVMEEGHPNRVLMNQAKQMEADLIALGARGHSIFARALLGSTSDYVANHARCPVLVVRPERSDRPADAPLRVLLAYDGSPGSRIAAAQMFQLAWSPQTQVQISMLLERPTLLPDEVVYDPSAIEDAERTLIELVDASKCSANVIRKVRETVHVGNAISYLAENEEADLIFLGDTGKSAIAQFFLGSASRHVLHHSTRSVWIARAKKWA